MQHGLKEERQQQQKKNHYIFRNLRMKDRDVKTQGIQCHWYVDTQKGSAHGVISLV